MSHDAWHDAVDCQTALSRGHHCDTQGSRAGQSGAIRGREGYDVWDGRNVRLLRRPLESSVAVPEVGEERSNRKARSRKREWLRAVGVPGHDRHDNGLGRPDRTVGERIDGGCMIGFLARQRRGLESDIAAAGRHRVAHSQRRADSRRSELNDAAAIESAGQVREGRDVWLDAAAAEFDL